MQNHLKDQKSPYLLQHVENPVDWYPWCKEAFRRAKEEDKPIFLSIGYSTCHWCHVMAHESFEDPQIAQILNQSFISIKVDKEERPDIDSVYMAVCQAFTGSGGWPMTVFLTPEKRPFFAGTYFPKTARYGRPGLKEILLAVREKWSSDREPLLESADEVVSVLGRKVSGEREIDISMIDDAYERYKRTFDREYGGFGEAPKFPAPHNLIFLMRYYEKSGRKDALKMAEKTLLQMYRGGIFDHIGGGFCRYSTDRYFLAPHFEKMLYDNALMILAYSKAFQITGNQLYCSAAEKTAAYIAREMTSPEGGFYSAQDADSEGVEGKYYLFVPSELVGLLGDLAGKEFNHYFGITEKGNFEGKSIPNLIENTCINGEVNQYLPAVYEYRRNRYPLHLDDKILTGWNALMIAAMCHLYRVTGSESYLDAAVRAQEFIWENLYESGTLYAGCREEKRGEKGFLDDYAYEILALLALYEATFEEGYLNHAKLFCDKAAADFWDEERGGFFLYGKENEQLIIRPKETYDGAIFSGNSAMAYGLVRLSFLTGEKKYEELLKRQLKFMSAEAFAYPTGYAMFLTALSDYLDPPDKVTVVWKDPKDIENLSLKIPLDTAVYILKDGTEEYPVKNGKTTFYVCKGQSCLPPVNDLGNRLK